MKLRRFSEELEARCCSNVRQTGSGNAPIVHSKGKLSASFICVGIMAALKSSGFVLLEPTDFGFGEVESVTSFGD